MELESGLYRRRTNEAEAIYGRTDYCDFARTRGWCEAADLARKHGISEATLYNWQAKYGGLDMSEARRLKALEDENRKLKKLLAESMLDNAAMKELLTKKW